MATPQDTRQLACTALCQVYVRHLHTVRTSARPPRCRLLSWLCPEGLRSVGVWTSRRLTGAVRWAMGTPSHVRPPVSRPVLSLCAPRSGTQDATKGCSRGLCCGIRAFSLGLKQAASSASEASSLVPVTLGSQPRAKAGKSSDEQVDG